MSLSLACFIGLATFDHNKDKSGWPIFNIILSVSLLLFITIIPFVLYRIIALNHEKLRETSFLSKYSSLYDSLDYTKPKALYYILVLFAKRFTIAFTLVIARQTYMLQFFIVGFVSLCTLVYYIKYRPFSTDYIHNMELVNEVTLIICLYFCLVFTDYQPSEELDVWFHKPTLGWVFIIIVLLNLAINFAGIFLIIIRFLIRMFHKALGLYRAVINYLKD